MIRAVLDTNVFVSTILISGGNPDRILDLWRKGRFILLISPPILEEIRRVLAYPRLRRRHRLSAVQIDVFLEGLKDTAIFVPGAMEVSIVEEDPDDNPLIACALEGQGDLVVTGDRHLLDLKHYRGIQIVSVTTFLRLLQEQA